MRLPIIIAHSFLIFTTAALAQGVTSYTLPGGNAITLPQSNVVDKIAPRGDTVWIGSGKGLSITVDGGQSWRQFSHDETFDDKGVSAIATRGNELWVATAYDTIALGVSHKAGHGLHFSSDRGATWTFVPQPLDTGKVDTLAYGRNKIPTLNAVIPIDNVTWDIAITSSSVWIASWAGMARKSTDHGKSWQRVILPPDNLNRITPFDTLRFSLSPVDHQFGTDSLIGNLNHRPFSLLASSDSIIWIGTAGGINKSTDGGISWRKFNHQNQAQSISGNWVLSIVEHQWGSRRVIWAATMNAVDPDEKRGVSFTTDGGETWNTALLGEWAHNIATRDSTVYVATDGGLYRSDDLGKSWSRNGTVYDPVTLQRFASSAHYAVGAHGDTVWTGGPEGLAYTLDSPSHPFGSVWKVFRTYQPVQAIGSTYSYPLPFSPASEVVRIHYSTAGKTVPVSIRIFDFAMQPVKTLLHDAPRSGQNEQDEIWDGRDDLNRRVTNGVYFYRVEISGGDARWGKIFVFQ